MKSVVSSIGKNLLKKKNKLGFSESCTGGLLSTYVTAFPGASKFYQGAIVSYASEVKHDLLGVPQKDLKVFGAVSERVALAMAFGTLKALRCDWAISVTGNAGPTGGTKKKPIGLVFYAVVGPKVAVVKKKIFSGGRRNVQKKAASEALKLLNELLQRKNLPR